jgi:toxin-antitoxin system PIN domain toxin
VIVPDVNLLLYAHMTAFAQHARARRWWEDLLNGETEVGLGAVALFAFIRLATGRLVVRHPMSVGDAVAHVETWLSVPHVRLALPGPRHLEISFGLLRQVGAAGNLTTDAQLAALAIENQAELHSNDTDFGRFPGLRWVNPLA